MILKPVVREFSKTDPEKITVAIKDLLNFREGGTASNREGRKKSLEGDDSIEQYLANA